MSIVSDFHTLTRPLRQAELDYLVAQGVRPLALAADPGTWGFSVGAANVTFLDGRFDFAGENDGAVPALVMVARDEDDEPVDLIAARLRDNVLASWEGRVALLGQQNLAAPRLGEPLLVNHNVLSWLRADRRGVVVVESARARRLLADAGALQADDLEHGLELQELVSYRPHVLVPSKLQAAA